MNGSNYVHLRIYVTGVGEEGFLKFFFRSLMLEGLLSITTKKFIGQYLPPTNSNRKVRNERVMPKLVEEFSTDIGRWVGKSEAHFALLVDDLEHVDVSKPASKRRDQKAVHNSNSSLAERNSNANERYLYYREFVERRLATRPDLLSRFSVHFFVNMIEAYYFKHPEVVNQVCETLLGEYPGDVENIRHPKREIDNAIRSIKLNKKFDEVNQGELIAKALDLRKVLEHPQHCRALRTLVAWIWEAMGRERSEEYQLEQGLYWDVTVTQLTAQPPTSQIRPLDAEE